jgi:hypothetical protein
VKPRKSRAAADGLTLSQRVPQKTPKSFDTLAAFKQVPVEKYALPDRTACPCRPRFTLLPRIRCIVFCLPVWWPWTIALLKVTWRCRPRWIQPRPPFVHTNDTSTWGKTAMPTCSGILRWWWTRTTTRLHPTASSCIKIWVRPVARLLGVRLLISSHACSSLHWQHRRCRRPHARDPFRIGRPSRSNPRRLASFEHRGGVAVRLASGPTRPSAGALANIRYPSSILSDAGLAAPVTARSSHTGPA